MVMEWWGPGEGGRDAAITMVFISIILAALVNVLQMMIKWICWTLRVRRTDPGRILLMPSSTAHSHSRLDNKPR
jgi:hypothetical protein